MVGIDALLNTSPLEGEELYDWRIDAVGDISTEDQLETAILVSLFTDLRASPGQVPVPQQRRGWIGDLETPDDPQGSHLWLLEQARLDTNAASLARAYAETALSWLVRDNIAVRLGVRTIIEDLKLTLAIDIERPNSRSETMYVALWDNTGV